MSNGSNIRQVRPSSKNFVVDYRDAKYQGEISEYDRLPNGMGMLMSINYQLVIAQWNEGQVNGPCLCVYPEGNIFYGNIANNQLSGFSVYQVDEKTFMYGLINREAESWIFVDLQLTNMLLCLRMSPQYISYFLSSQHRHEIREQQAPISDIDFRLKKKAEMAGEFTYSSEDEKWSEVAKVTGKAVPSEFKDMKAFMKYHFNIHAPNKATRLEITQTRDFLELRYKKAGIICRIDEHAPNSGRIKFLGYYDTYEQYSDVYRKTGTGPEGEIQQYCQGYALTYTKDRPPICKKNLQNHFRKSVHFVNHFISLDFVSRLRYLHSEIFTSVDAEMSTKNAQSQLQRGVGSIESTEKAVNQTKPTLVDRSAKVELADIKNDIYNRVKKKKNSPGTDKDSSFAEIRSPFDKYAVNSNYIHSELKENYQYVSPARGRQRKYLEETTPKRSREYLKYTENSPVGKIRYSRSNKRQESNENPGRRKYSYMPVEQSQDEAPQVARNLNRTKSNAFIEDHNYNNYNNDYIGHREEGHLYSRHQNMARPPNPHTESIGSLASNYERIKNQLSQEKKINSKRQYERTVSPSYNGGTPSNRSPARRSHLKYPVHSPSGGTGRKRQWR